MSMRNQRTLAAVIAVVGVLAVVVGIVYLTVQAKSLPGILGQLHGMTGHRSKRGVAALVVGVVLLLAGGGLIAYKPRVTR
jgi:hypothetical protein